MTLKRYTFETGPNGAALTPANCGADQINAGSGTATFDQATAQVGQFGARVVNTVGDRSTLRFLAAASNTKLAFEANFQVNGSQPASECNIVNFLDPSNTPGPYVSLTNAGLVSLYAKGGVGGRHAIESVTVAGKYRLAVVLEITSGTTATYSANLYDGPAGTVPLNASPVTGTFDAGITSFGGIYTGLISPVVGDATFDAVALDDGATSEIGPPPNPGNAADTVHATSVSSNPGGWVAFGATDLVDVLSDASDSTGIRSADTGGAITYNLAELTDGPITISMRHRLAAGASAASRKYELLCDGTVIRTENVAALPATVTDYTFGPTDTGETANITDRTKLAVRITDTPA